MKRYLLFPLCVLAALLWSVNVHAQRKNQRYVDYINTYSDLAVQQMKLHKIPASITLAQGILESGAGTSQLAKKSNNHFGIKCGSSWKGRSVRHHDDARNECFRAYKSVKDSYEDHSLFLVRGARYAFLFNLDITDYKGWARGLKKAGYATDPSYANRLITLIEDYELYKYDTSAKRSSNKKTAVQVNPHALYLTNDLAYVVARDGDTFQSIGKEFGIHWKKLVRYNDLHKEYTLAQGDRIFLKTKKKRADRNNILYIVKDGDSMHTISQLFGIQLKSLYQMNRKTPYYVPEVGDRLRLR